MLYHVFVFFDKKAGFYDRSLMTFRTQAEALRDCIALASDPQKRSRLSIYPEDFQLWEIATLDDDTGVIKPHAGACFGLMSDLMAPASTPESAPDYQLKHSV